MIENKKRLLLNEKELSNVSAGKSVHDTIEELRSFSSQYPEIIEIVETYYNSDFGKAIELLQKFKVSHPELSNIFDD